jgi:hypothetical protein
MSETGGKDHEARVREAFDALHRNVVERLDDQTRSSLDGLRSAAENRDATKLRAGLTSVQEQHGWLYRELAAHPDVATLLNELALWGF